eukprot:400041_1
MFNLAVISFFGICAILILIPTIIYTYRSTIPHLSQTAGTMKWTELASHTNTIDKFTWILETFDTIISLLFTLYLLIFYHNTSNILFLSYICLISTCIGFALIFIKLKLTTKLYNIFTEWKKQKNELITANINIEIPSNDDIREMHSILLDIKSHEFDVAMFDLYSISLQNMPILCCIILLTIYNHNTKFNKIVPLITMIISIFVICFKLMKLIIIKTGCNDSSNVPSKFATFRTYRPSWTNKNYNTDDNDEDLESNVSPINTNENTDDILSVGSADNVLSDHDDIKDNECTSLNMYFGTTGIGSDVEDMDNIIIDKSSVPIATQLPSLLKQDSRFGKTKKAFRTRTNTAHV